MIVHKIEQRSQEWYNIRKGKMTASSASTIIANGKGLENYIISLMAEKYSSASPIKFTNPDIERGIKLESEARKAYEKYTNQKVDEVGFIEVSDMIGCSPDGLVGEYGGIEIKCPNDTNYFKILLGGIEEVSKEYIDQIQMNLFLTRRQWWDYVAYNPNFETELITFRIYPDKKIFDKIEAGLKSGCDKITFIQSKFNKDIGYETK